MRPPVIQVPQHNPALTPGNVTAELEPILRDYRRLWLVLADPHMEDPDGLALPWLQSRLETSFDQRFNDKRLLLLAAAPQTLAAPLNAAQPQHPIAASDSSPVRPTGYDLPVPRVVPGESAYQAVYWQNGAGRTITYTWRHESGREVGVVTATLPAVQDGDARSIVELPAYGATPAGAYRLIAQLPDASAFDLPGPTVAGTRSLPAGPLRDAQPAQVGDFELLGFAVEPAGAAVSRGQTVTLYLDWRIGRRADRRYTFFAHLLGDAFNPATNGPVWAGQDSEPLGGGLPTPQWWTGDVIRDELKLSVPADAPPGQYQIEIGAYPTGDPQRLAVEGEGADAANRRVILNLPVKIE